MGFPVFTNMPPMPPSKEVPIKIITRCDNLMMDVFIECLVSKDYTALIASGEPSAEQLNESWNDIMAEFANLSGNTEYEKIITLTKEININRLKFYLVERTIQVLELQYSEDLVKELKRMGFPGQYDWNLQERYQRELKAAYSKAKLFVVTADSKQKELDKMNAKSGGDELDRKYFDKMFIALSGYFKYQVKEHEITVQKYCFMVKSMNDFYDSQLSKK